MFIYFGYPDGYSSAVPGYCLLLAFMSWMAENVFLPNIYLLSYIVLFPPPHLDQGRMPNSFPFWDGRTWLYGSYQKRCSLACNYLFCSTGVLFSWAAWAESCGSVRALSVEHHLAVCVWDGGAEWHQLDGVVFTWSPCFLSHCIWPDISSWHNITVGVASVFFF